MLNESLPPSANGFVFTEREQLFDRISHERLLSILGDATTLIHDIALDTNTYGEFLFVTASRPAVQKREVRTFWGLGLPERRERYLLDEWFWYEAVATSVHLATHVSTQDPLEQIKNRRQLIEPEAKQTKQSHQGTLFEMLADLTDEDGAASDIDDGRAWWEAE